MRDHVIAPWLLVAALLLAPIAQAAEVPARLDWSQRLELSSPVSGVVARVPVSAGQRVDKGQLLVAFDDRRLQADLRQAKADVRRLKLTRNEARREYERAQELYDRTVIAEHDLKLAHIDYAVAQSEYVAAQSKRQRTRLDLEYSRLTAPFDGVVVALHVAAGETVRNELTATPMVVIGRDHPMIARAQVGEGRLAGLEAGQELTVEVEGKRYPGELLQPGMEAQMVDGRPMFEIEVEFTPARRYRAGQGAMIELPEAEPEPGSAGRTYPNEAQPTSQEGPT